MNPENSGFSASLSHVSSTNQDGPVIALVRLQMTLKIERSLGQSRAQIRLSGEFRVDQVQHVKAEIELCGRRVALDLEEVVLVDIEAVRFLNQCQSEGIRTMHCSPFIREWMRREQRLKGGRGAAL